MVARCGPQIGHCFYAVLSYSSVSEHEPITVWVQRKVHVYTLACHGKMQTYLHEIPTLWVVLERGVITAQPGDDEFQTQLYAAVKSTGHHWGY